MAVPEMIKDLLENGVHFGHLSKHWNPKMKKFIFGKKKNVYVIDLEKTARSLEEAKEFIKQVAARGEKILFVATKKQLRDLIKEQATSCGMGYIVERWVGGFLTNFSTIQGRIQKYLDLREKKDRGDFDKMPGKEVVRLNRELERMDKNYSGVASFDDLPGCICVIDPKKEFACVREANKLSVPLVGLIDTDGDPEVLDYPIPGNDDAIKSVRYIISCLVEAVNEGLKLGEKLTKKKEKETAKEKKEEASQEEVASEGLKEEGSATEEKKTTRKSRKQQKEE
ncbi:MAG: 30S ribosomal protein S2 [Candidatus Omnitrophota bacterium]|nr:MAG: 30S ribosomal protein S2 [Candidatus Omnitrophota bacterium]